MVRRLFRLFVVLSAIAIVAVIAVFIASNTPFGRERVRRFIVGIIGDQTHGYVRVDAVHGNLLSGATLVKVAITDSATNPFFKADSMTLRYVVRSFLSSRLEFSDVIVYHPEVVVARSPAGGPWNYRILWPTPPKRAAGDTTHGWGDWVKLTNATIVNGDITVRSPWSPRTGLTARVRDSVIKDALSAGSRLYIAKVPGGYQKVVTLEKVNAVLPLVRWADPMYRTRLLRVSALNMNAFPFRPPAARVTALAGSFEFNDDSLWWKGARGELPKSSFKGDGVYDLNSGDMRLSLAVPRAEFGDFKWLYPNMPEDGGGHLALGVTWKGATQDYVIRDGDMRTGGAHITGDIGVSIADTLYFHDADLHFANLATQQIEKWSPGLKSPRDGVLTGRAKFSGTLKRLALASSDVTFDAYRRGTSRVIASGVIGFRGQTKVIVRASDLHVRLEPLQMDIVKLLFPTLPVGGTLSGTTVMSGSGDTQLRFSNIDIVHVDGYNISHAVGSASSHTTGRQTLDLDVVARPLALAEITKFAPKLKLKGLASGPVHAHGPIDASHVDAQLSLPGGGFFGMTGTVDFLSKELGYDVAINTRNLDLSWVMLFGPRTSLTGTINATGRGFLPGTMVSDIGINLGKSSIDTLAVDSIVGHAKLARGVATIDEALILGAGAEFKLSGQFGLDSLHSGTLSYEAHLDSLSKFARFIPGANSADTAVVTARPRLAFEALKRARADSASAVKETEIARIIGNLPPVTLKVPTDTPRAIPKGLLAGSIDAKGTLAGSLDGFSVDGRADAKGLIVQGNAAKHLHADYKLDNVFSTRLPNFAVAVAADSISAYGFAFDSLAAKGNYAGQNGTASIRVIQSSQREYGLNGDFTVDTARNELRLANVDLRFDSTDWRSAHPSTVRFGKRGVEVINLELTNGPGRRIYANGLLPTKGVANFDLSVSDFAVENVAELLQSDLAITGRLTLDAHVSGDAADPRLAGKLDFVKGMYNDVPVPEVHGTFNYANRRLVTDAKVVDSTGKVLASLDGTVPIDLALSGVTGSRLLDLPINAKVFSDSLPLGLIPRFTGAVANLSGKASGNVTVGGTLKKPRLTGDLEIQNVGFTLAATGAELQRVNGRLRMTGDSVYVDSIAGIANGPVRISGAVSLGNLSAPAFDLSLMASDAQLLNNATGDLHADAQLQLSGSFVAPTVTGTVTVLHGVIYIPESSGKKVIGPGDPSLFSVVDTSVKLQRDLFPAESPMFKNLHADVQLSVERNTWVRSRDANVEIFTDGPVAVNVVGDALSLTGAVDADRGEYTFLSKRFQIKRGTALFIGTPDLNPTLQVTADYQVKSVSGATNIQVLIGGTLLAPRISLESDAQPPLSQSDLLSYLAFGQSSASLLQFNQTSLSGGQAGNLLSVASTRLAGVALGVALDEVKGSAARSLGLDVFNITPGDIPVTQGQGGFDQFLRGTEVEGGRYVNPRTFVSFILPPGSLTCIGRRTQGTACNTFGLGYSQRTAKGLTFDVSYAPRYFLDPTTLLGQTYTAGGQFGAFIIREWRF